VGLTGKAYMFFFGGHTVCSGTDLGLIVSGGQKYFISGYDLVGLGEVEGTCFQALQLVHLRNSVVPFPLVLDI
jgi:hypothetical protein